MYKDKKNKKKNNISSQNLDKNNQYKNDIKIIIIGTSGANKVEFVNRWTKNEFSYTYKTTIVSEYGFKLFEYNGKIYRI